MSDIVKTGIDTDLAVLTIENPPVNTLNHAVRVELIRALETCYADPALSAIILTGQGKFFSAGLDIEEFNSAFKTPEIMDLLRTMLASNKPLVAALNGIVLGGGLETALSCHYRVADSRARLGFPEVKLGFIPGATGTQVLPRLIGVEPALDIIISGRNVAAEEAKKLGFVDDICEGNLLEAAREFARKVCQQGEVLPDISQRVLDKEKYTKDFFSQYRKKVAQRSRGLLAPAVCVDAVEAAVTMPFEEGVVYERKRGMECVHSAQSAALRHVFFSERKTAVIAGLSDDAQAKEISSVAVVGAGQMGTGIALSFLNAGIAVKLLELNREVLDKGIERITSYFQSLAKKGRMTEVELNKKCKLLEGILDYDSLSEVDLVVEAVSEQMTVKKQVFQSLDKACHPACVLASNTSTLDINELASATGRPESVIGLHFFNPANVMRVVEVVRTDKVADDVLKTAMDVVKKINKVGVLAAVCDGFIGNRMIVKYFQEAESLLLEGAMPDDIDRVLTQFGMAMGPLMVMDLIGLDILHQIRKDRRQAGIDLPILDGVIVDGLVHKGRFGQKAGKGFYQYGQDTRNPTTDSEVLELISDISAEMEMGRRNIDDTEILHRCLYSMINEAAKILEEEIAQRPSDIDVLFIYGYGFPAYAGGPLHYADSVGLDAVLAAIKSYQFKHGDNWSPAPLLERLVNTKQTFASLNLH